MSDHDACQTPLLDLMRSVPKTAVLQWLDGNDWRASSHNSPVGRYLHEAAAEIERLERYLARSQTAEADCAAMLRRAESAERQRDEANELHTLQMAAIMTATVTNTRETAAQHIDRDHPYWTQAYADVRAAVAREMAERERADEAIAALRELVRLRDALVDARERSLGAFVEGNLERDFDNAIIDARCLTKGSA